MIDWWWFLLLALASWRVFRLIAEDTILNTPRRRILRLGDWQEEDDPHHQHLPDEYRDHWATFLTCPYCAGFWMSGIALALYSLIIDWHGAFEFFVTWFALSAVVAYLAKTDEYLNKLIG